MLKAALAGRRAPEHAAETAGPQLVPGCSKWDQSPPDTPAESDEVVVPGPTSLAVPLHTHDHLYEPPDYSQAVEVEDEE